MCYRVLTIEGLDGSGKATQAEILFKKLQLIKIAAYKVSFPNYKSESSALVRMHLNSKAPKERENVYAVSSFFAADRYLSYVNSWKKFYESGHLIIADRYTTSNAIYQLSNLENTEWNSYLAWLEDYEYCKLSLPRPNLVIYLDMPVEKSQELILKRYNGNENKKDLYERDINRLKRCREAAMYVSGKYNWKIINCIDEKTSQIKSVPEIHEMIFSLVTKAFG